MANREEYANSASTTLAAQLNSGATSISLTSGASFPTGRHRVRIDNEIILVASRSSNTLTVATGGRGAENTSDVLHSAGATVTQVLTRRGLFASQGWHDVKSYGAVGNDASDDYAAIQAAIDDAGRNGRVYFPPGTYLVNTGLTFYTGQKWRGVGGPGAEDYDQTTLHFGGASGTLVQPKWATESYPYNFEIEGMELNGDTGADIMLDFIGCLYNTAKKLFIQGSKANAIGLRLSGATNMCYFNQVIHCNFFTGGTGAVGLYLASDANANWIYDCKWWGCPTGISFNSSSVVNNVLNCDFESNTTHIYINAPFNKFWGNHMEGATNGYEFTASGYSTSISDTSMSTVTNPFAGLSNIAGADPKYVFPGNILGSAGIFTGTGSPENVVTANVGSLYLRTDSSTSLYVKQTGTGNTGWVSK